MQQREVSEVIDRSIKSTAFKPGDKVKYKPATSDHANNYGVVTSINKAFVFVRYGNEPTAKSTRPEDLELINE